MKKLLVLIILSLSFSFAYSANSPVSIQGIEVAYGAYDVMLGMNVEIMGWDFWKIKPTFRFNVFYNSYKIGIWNEYFPLSQFNVGFWIFNSRKLNPFVLLGVQFPYDFSTMSTPIGVGFEFPLLNKLYMGFRLYSDVLIAPTFYTSASWDIYFNFEF